MDLGYARKPRAASAAAVNVTSPAQQFLSSYSAVYNTFNFDRHLVSRRTLRQFRAETANAWQQATAAA